MQNSRISNRLVRKMKKKYTILASNGPRMLGDMFHQNRLKAKQFCGTKPHARMRLKSLRASVCKN